MVLDNTPRWRVFQRFSSLNILAEPSIYFTGIYIVNCLQPITIDILSLIQNSNCVAMFRHRYNAERYKNLAEDTCHVSLFPCSHNILKIDVHALNIYDIFFRYISNERVLKQVIVICGFEQQRMRNIYSNPDTRFYMICAVALILGSMPMENEVLVLLACRYAMRRVRAR
ncbi:hypothetical protein F5Y04DRAFT_89450 [Hypomontagnella monticulosa]|nr:hypothetical protein F5Y04DRAFT_89450 [Hypomontagnella monticulosa]